MTVDEQRLEEALVGRLRLLAGDEPDLGADVRAAQRARLVAMAAVRPDGAAASDDAGAAVRSPAVDRPRWRRALAGRTADVPFPRWRTRLTAGLAGAAMTVGALSGLLALAQDAEPGDLLYGLKRGSEQTQLALASDADRGLTLLGFASVRLQELTELTGEDAGALPAGPGSPDGTGTAPAAAGPDAATVVDVLTTMDRQTTEGTSSLTTGVVDGADPAALETLARWADGQRSGLVALAVPAGAEEAQARAVALVERVAARASSWQTALECPDGPTTADVDALGPVAGGCVVPPGAVPSTTAAPGGGATAVPAPGDPGSTSAGSAPAAPTAGTTGTAGTAPQPTASAAPTTTAAPAVPSVVAPVPTAGSPTTTVPPLVQVPLPVPSATVCVGGLVCVGG